ncbi:type II secretion system protein GspM, partial [Pseudomonas aeruginosa]|uniref:type II secretion system protein GspM n=1 Tax=Pseudomonas aeruginosa TaxID=287 RepID=UPI0030137099
PGRTECRAPRQRRRGAAAGGPAAGAICQAAALAASAAQAGLSVERLDNEGEAPLQVALQPAPFAKLLPW